MLNEYAIFQNSYLGAITRLANRHHAFNRFASGKEFSFGQDRGTATTLIPALLTALLLGF
jgi:hypothetical protein